MERNSPFRVRHPLRPRLLCTRGFHPYYCVDIVVRAFAEAQKPSRTRGLIFIGSGPLEKNIRNLVSEMKLTGVDFKGRLPQ